MFFSTVNVLLVVVVVQFCCILYLIQRGYQDSRHNIDVHHGWALTEKLAVLEREDGNRHSFIQPMPCVEKESFPTGNITVNLSPVLSTGKRREPVGAAVTVFMGSPKWFQNRYAMMVNQILAVVPEDWVVQIFYLPHKKMAVEAVNYPGIKRQISRGRVILTEIPVFMRKIKKKDLVSSIWFWEGILAERVLLFGGNSVLCANADFEISKFDQFDYIGAPWSRFNGRGGEGGFSVRSRRAVLQVLHGSNAASSSGGKDVANVVAMPVTDCDTRLFAMTSNQVEGYPLGAMGVLAELNDTTRQHYVDYCPELKMMFPSLHSPSCFGAEPDYLGCFRYLCEYGGLKCKKSGTMSWRSAKGEKVQLQIDVSRN